MKIKEDPGETYTLFKTECFDQDMLTELLKWIKKNKSCYREIQYTCGELSESKNPKTMNHFSLYVDLMDLMEFYCPLGSLALKDPVEFTSELQKVICLLVASNNWLKYVTCAAQISVLPRFQNFPAIRSNQIVSQRDFKQLSRTGTRLIKLTGMVSGISNLASYTKSTTFRCPQEDCAGVSNRLYHVCLPGMSEYDVVRCNTLCDVCGNPLEEIVEDRMVGEKYLAFFLPCDEVGQVKQTINVKKGIKQCIHVTVKDTLDVTLQLGQMYEVTGVFLSELSEEHGTGNATSPEFEAFHISKVIDDLLPPLPLEHPKLQAIRRLYEDRKTSPWSFASSLAYCFAANVCPGGTYHKLKLCLILSLVCTKNQKEIRAEEDLKVCDKSEDDKLHLLLITDDVVIPQRLFAIALSYNKESFIHWAANTLFAKAVKSNLEDYTWMTEGGSVPLAGSGVCYIPNMTLLKSNILNDLQRVLELKKLKVDASRSFMEKQKLTSSVGQLQATLWATAEIPHKLNSHPDDFGSTAELFNQIPKALADQFSLVFALNSGENAPTFHELLIISHLLEERSERAKKRALSPISSCELAEFLEMVKHRRIKFKSEALDLLRSFFLASRRVRPNTIRGCTMPHGSLTAMISLAEAHAKLSLRNEVIVEDAVLAVLIYEESLCTQFGASVLGIHPTMHFESDSLMANLGPENDARMRQLEKQIYYFCSSYCPGFSKNTTIDVEE